MRRSLLVVLALVGCAAPTAKPPTAVEIPRAEVSAAPVERVAPPAPVSTEVTYHGQVWTSGELMPVETTLKATGTGLSGRYVMIDGARNMPGELSNCFATDGSHFTCMWTDEFGVGGFELEFSADRQRFEGEWWPEASPETRYPWTGSILPVIAE